MPLGDVAGGKKSSQMCQVKSSQVTPSQTKPSQVKPSQVKPSQVKSNQVKSAQDSRGSSPEVVTSLVSMYACIRSSPEVITSQETKDIPAMRVEQELIAHPAGHT